MAWMARFPARFAGCGSSRTLAPLLPYADSLMLTRGVLRNCVPHQADLPIVLRMSGGTSIHGELSHEGLLHTRRLATEPDG